MVVTYGLGKIRISSRGNCKKLRSLNRLIGQTIGTFRLFEDNLEEREDVRARGFTTNLAKRINPNSNLVLYRNTKNYNIVEKLMKNKVLSTTTCSLGVSFRRDNRDDFSTLKRPAKRDSH